MLEKTPITSDTYATIDYAGIIALNVAKIQEQEKQISDLNKTIIETKKQINNLCIDNHLVCK